MGDDASVTGIIIFAAIAVFLIFQLRAVLGRRSGTERDRPNPFDRPAVAPYRPGMAEQPAGPTARPSPVIEHDPNLPLSLDAKMARVLALDPTFDEKHFLAGARSAFQMIVQAFATGDLATLRPLLSSQLYGELGREISTRRDRNELGPVQFDGPFVAEIVEARTEQREVQIQVQFQSRQIHAGEAAAPEEPTVDLWTFARDTGSRDPNWQLIETATPG